MATFNLNKGDKFDIKKGINNVLIGLGWDVSKVGKIDIDAHAFGCVTDDNGTKFYNDASHAITYANKGQLVVEGNKFGTHDGSMKHTGDNRNGAGSGDDEAIAIDLSKLPKEINDILIFLTIHEAKTNGQNFGIVDNSFVRVLDADANVELCRYDLRKEFANAISIQVGSLVKADNGNWSFAAIGAGTPTEDLGDILGKLS